jgi:DNA-binding Xre family transcriptional regulator
MNLNKAFDQTLKDFGISAKWLSECSGVAPQIISDFRRGKKAIQTDSLEKLLDALPVEVQTHFFSVFLGGQIAPEKVVALMDTDQLSSMLFAIAESLKNRRRNTDEKSDRQLVTTS